MQKSLRKITAKETLKILEDGFYVLPNDTKISIKEEQDYAENNSKYYTSSDLDKIKNTIVNCTQYQTKIEVVEETSINAIIRLNNEGFSNVMCLNFASAKNPGGGFLNGAQAQEESIARSSGIHNCQVKNIAFYENHRAMKSCVYTDSMIYSPKVPVFRKDNGELIEPILTSIITAAAVNTGVIKRQEQSRVDDIEEIMSVRIDKLLALSLSKKDSVLVLGAWGCGVFQNDPVMIARLFANHLNNKYKSAFEKIVFAIYAKNKKFIAAFKNEFEK
jgi:uncharacterized protein (TIGR02452 family)